MDKPRKDLPGLTQVMLCTVYKLDAKTATAKSLPFDEATPCPAGNIIQVKKTDNGFGIGTITPAGPWVPVASNCSKNLLSPPVLFFLVPPLMSMLMALLLHTIPVQTVRSLPYTFTLTPALTIRFGLSFFIHSDMRMILVMDGILKKQSQ